MTSNELQKYSTLFCNSLSQDENVRNSATAVIEGYLREKRLKFMNNCLMLIKQQNLNILLIKQALLFINMALSPTFGASFDDIQELWAENIKQGQNNIDIAEEYIGICINLLSHEDNAIREISSQCLSRIFSVHRGRFDKYFTKIFEIVKNPSTQMIPRISALIALKYQIQYISTFPAFSFSDNFQHTFHEIGDFFVSTVLPNYQQFSTQFISEYYETMAALRSIQIRNDQFEIIKPEIDEERASINIQFIEQFFLHTFNTLVTAPVFVFVSIHHFLFALVESYYDRNICSIDQLFGFIVKLNFPMIIPPTEKSYIAIDFWNEICRFERDRIKIINKIEKYEEIRNFHHFPDSLQCKEPKPVYQNVINNICAQLLPLLFQSMTVIDVTDNEVEDISLQIEPHMYATSCVRKIFNINPEICFQNVIGFFEQTKSSLDWNIRHAQMLLIWCICDCSFYLPVFEYIQSISDFFIQTLAQNNDNLRLVETTISALSAAFNTYKLFINPEQGLVLMNLISNYCKNPSTVIIQRSLQLLVSFISSFDKTNPNSGIDSILPLTQQIILDVSHVPDFFETFYVRNLYQVKVSIIQSVHRSRSNIIIPLMEESFNNFMNAPHPAVFLGELDVICTIMSLFGEYFIEKGIIVAQKLISTLNGANQAISEDCLSYLINIVTALGSNSAPLVPQIKEQVSIAYNSQSPSMIINLNRIIGLLFSTTGPLMEDVLVPTVTSIIQILNNINDENSFILAHQVHFLLYPLAQILQAVPRELPINESLRDQFYQIFKVFRTFPAPNDECLNLLFEALLIGFASIISSSDRQFLIKQKLEIFKIVGFVNKIQNKSDGLLHAYCDFMETAGSVMLNDNLLKIKLLNNENMRPIIWAEASSDVNLKKRAHDLLTRLKK
ncbi:hypothetical protein TRFO_21639 [Tritrichomonas foetus]|uniref:Importin N-terminal domain-containing protein n=1 Tax=Tritrichomonas foetus TaxID=1144522 RepID=A0A1J4KIA5_9EUKA|nr:hypothetical protein TRFO_21639 [Tritrichomonas foetus]|eukprot:OHT09414.1 hypothetical protein TRFO_21639 [Tritrichomonas foetus]